MLFQFLDSVIKSFCNSTVKLEITYFTCVRLKFYVSFARHSTSLQVFITVEQFIIRYNY